MRYSDGPTDEQLIADYNAGDGSAFEAIYYRYRDWIVRLAWRFTGDMDDALDVLQETFAYFHRKFPGFKLTARLTTFFYPVVRNLSLEARRKRIRSLGAGDEMLDQVPTACVDGPSELAAALRDLGAGQREVILMRFVDDLSLEEIAAALAIPLGTVKSRLHNGLAMLRANPSIKEIFVDP